MRLKLKQDYGVGDVVVVVSVVVLVSAAGVAVSIGVVSAGVVVTVVLLFVVVSVEAAGEVTGLTTVVLFSVFSAGEAAGAAVSVFCSHATRSAALARMQIYFFIRFWIEGPCWGHNGFGASEVFGPVEFSCPGKNAHFALR